MSKHITFQRFVYKIHTSRLRRNQWHLRLTVGQARDNKELIALSESQILRFIDELKGIPQPEQAVREIRSQIRHLKTEKNLAVSRPKIKKLYEALDEYQFIKDYVCIVIDSDRDYKKIYKDGFRINGITYRRLLATTGGVKNNTIVFVSEKLLPELKRRIDNGRDLTKAFTPAKLEAYMALVCSSSTPVSMPKGIAVVPDCVTRFKADIIELDDTGREEPRMKYISGKEMTLNDSDGYGLAMPGLMEQWGRDIGENYLLPGCVIRNAFCKGAVFPVDFRKFARDRGISVLTDVWGHVHPVEEIELVLTQSMLKLWDSYPSMDAYLENCEKNHYTFAITKASGRDLEHMRTMNYQFLQSYNFSPEDIDTLIAPTVQEIQEILSEDWRKTVLYTMGTSLTEETVRRLIPVFTTALMIAPEMMEDSYVKDQIRSMIHKRIDEAKVGVLNVPANYSLVCGDPYALCQSMFGLEVTGLLKPGQVYSRYWSEKHIPKIASFRAPMTCHNNIRVLEVAHSREMDSFYQYMTTPTIFNSWDTCADAMNGMDKDGDCVINTSFPLLIDRAETLPAILCVQRKAPKCIPSEDDLMQSNRNSFGNAVGEVTNKITSMFEVRARFPEGSREYRILDYRIKCGQLYQQNSIDKTKGIEASPMPKSWYTPASKPSDRSSWQNSTLTADKKPYFMQYIYPSERAGYKDYLKRNNEKSLMRFRISLEELLHKKDPTAEETAFIRSYKKGLPLGTAPCTMNRICWKIESLFDEPGREKPKDFDYSILKSGVHYSSQLFNKIKKVYERYRRETSAYMQFAKSERLKPEERQVQRYLFKEEFQRECLKECPNEDYLCDIVLDLCYTKTKNSKQFAWDVCGEVFIKNLLKRHNGILSYPEAADDGDIHFHGMHFKMKTIHIPIDTPKENE